MVRVRCTSAIIPRMTVDDWLKYASAKLGATEVPSARLDALILLEDALNKDRSWLLAHTKTKLNVGILKKLNRQIDRRAKHEPLAYIRGFTEFYGRTFKINRHVLEPRPESETMIDLLKTLSLPARPELADIGTGCGALGITANLEIPSATVDLYDIDSSALAVARHNCALHELHMHAYKRDLLNKVSKNYDAILANLPYVPTSWNINRAASHEPAHAIRGGSDGMDYYRRLFEQLQERPALAQYVLCESMPLQHPGITIIAKAGGYKKLKTSDLIQVFQRVV